MRHIISHFGDGLSRQSLDWCKTQLTLSLPIPLNLYTLPYGSDLSFLIFDIRAPERPNVKH